MNYVLNLMWFVKSVQFVVSKDEHESPESPESFNLSTLSVLSVKSVFVKLYASRQ